MLRSEMADVVDKKDHPAVSQYAALLEVIEYRSAKACVKACVALP